MGTSMGGWKKYQRRIVGGIGKAGGLEKVKVLIAEEGICF